MHRDGNGAWVQLAGLELESVWTSLTPGPAEVGSIGVDLEPASTGASLDSAMLFYHILNFLMNLINNYNCLCISAKVYLLMIYFSFIFC